jgi:Fe-S-cluster formation regulator IscX/YfhJ
MQAAASGSSRREKVAYAVGSLVVAWISASLLVAAGPASATMAKVYPLFEPGLRTFDLEHDWGFFAPDPGTGHVVRYEVRDAHGETRAFGLTEELERWDPAYFRFTTLYTKASVVGAGYEDGALRMLCRRHADIDPTSIRIVVAHQKPVSAEEYLEGVDPMENLDVFPQDWRPCPTEEGE